MAITSRRKAAAGGLAAAAALCGVLAMGATSASASGELKSPASPQVTFEGGAYDLDGNLVPTRTYVSDTPPADLGSLEASGSAAAGSELATGTLPE